MKYVYTMVHLVMSLVSQSIFASFSTLILQSSHGWKANVIHKKIADYSISPETMSSVLFLLFVLVGWLFCCCCFVFWPWEDWGGMLHCPQEGKGRGGQGMCNPVFTFTTPYLTWHHALGEFEPAWGFLFRLLVVTSILFYPGLAFFALARAFNKIIALDTWGEIFNVFAPKLASALRIHLAKLQFG